MPLDSKNIKDNELVYDPLEEEVVFTDTVNVIDKDWIESSFMVNLLQLADDHKISLLNTTANSKFTNTGIGNSLAINVPYAMTRYADIPVKGRMAENVDVSTRGANHKMGMGRYYSEALDDNMATTTLFLEFGVPNFTSMFSFFSRAVDYKESVIANEGRYPWAYDVGKIAGTVVLFRFYPAYGALAFILSNVLKISGAIMDSRYYTLKPTQFMYWSTVQTITTFLATERGIVTPVMQKSKTGGDSRVGMSFKYDNKSLAEFHKFMPDLFTEDHTVNVFGVATRTQRRINAQLAIESELRAGTNLSAQAVKDKINKLTGALTDDKDSDYQEYLKSIVGKAAYKEIQTENQDLPKAESSKNILEYTVEDAVGSLKALPSEIGKYTKDIGESYLSTVQHGAQHAIFNIEYVGSSSDTFTNSTKDIPIKDKMNSIGGAARDVRFSLSGGNIIGGIIDDMKKASTDIIAGALDGATFGLSNVIAGLLGGSYINFPKMWSDSSMSLASHTFKMRLGGPYGNAISQIMDIDIPLAMILAGTLPLSAGKSTYTSPFICKAFIRGVMNIDFGMITSLSIAKATGNLGYTKDGRPLALEISFTITDFSELITAPTNSSVFGAYNLSVDMNSSLNKYLGVLGGRDLRTNSYLTPKILLAVSRASAGLDVAFSPQALGMRLGDSIIGDLHGIVLPDISAATITKQ